MPENQTIHEFDLDLICDYFARMNRQGPGSPDMTLRALSFVEGLTENSRIADLGCGTGGQTMTLARQAEGTITGIDLFPKFIDLFNQNAGALGLQDKARGIVGSMDDLPFGENELDLIWCEGAIYNIGYERGLQEWRKFIKPGGYVAVTEAAWFTDTRPAQIEDFWMEAYDQIDTIPQKLAQLQSAGYVPTACFTLPETCWTDHYYALHPDIQKAFLAEHPGNGAANAFVEYQRHEQGLYETYKEYYGYAFFIGRKR